jgi:hypothetical protein
MTTQTLKHIDIGIRCMMDHGEEGQCIKCVECFEFVPKSKMNEECHPVPQDDFRRKETEDLLKIIEARKK